MDGLIPEVIVSLQEAFAVNAYFAMRGQAMRVMSAVSGGSVKFYR